ncbi:MAG: cytidylate kinase family protein [Desulfamplus sp.]|nr:cytidylate kinase family protein [Desulfamplus sp.]
MSIIIISSDVREIEENIARKVADELGYNLLDRSILEDVAAKHQINSEKLKEYMETTPSLFKNLSSKQWRYYLASIEAEVLERLVEDKIVCSGLAANLYVTGVSHALKVHLLSGNRECIENIGVQGAQKEPIIKKTRKDLDNELQQRKKWSLTAYNCDETDLSKYDMVINLDQIDPAEAVKTITSAVEYRKFQVMTYSMKCLSNLALAARVNVKLLESMTDIKVEAKDGSVVVFTKASNRQKRKKIATIKELAGNVEGVGYVEVHVNKNINDKSA